MSRKKSRTQGARASARARRARASHDTPGARANAAEAAATLSAAGIEPRLGTTRRDRVAASAIVVELLDHVRRHVEVPEEQLAMETVALVCTAGWNASRLAIQGEANQAKVTEVRRRIALLVPDMAPIFEHVFALACTMHPADRRTIVSVNLEFHQGRMQLNASSVGGDD